MRVLVAGDGLHSVVEALSALDDVASVQTVGSLYDVPARLAEAGDYDLIVLDARLPGMEGFVGLPLVAQQRPQTAIAVAAPILDRASVLAAVRRGARGYIPIAAGGRELQEAVDAMIAGDLYIAPSVLQHFRAAC
jgi:DNA-binding NarL/FixJ family response regulator